MSSICEHKRKLSTRTNLYCRHIKYEPYVRRSPAWIYIWEIFLGKSDRQEVGDSGTVFNNWWSFTKMYIPLSVSMSTSWCESTLIGTDFGGDKNSRERNWPWFCKKFGYCLIFLYSTLFIIRMLKKPLLTWTLGKRTTSVCFDLWECSPCNYGNVTWYVKVPPGRHLSLLFRPNTPWWSPRNLNIMSDNRWKGQRRETKTNTTIYLDFGGNIGNFFNLPRNQCWYQSKRMIKEYWIEC